MMRNRPRTTNAIAATLCVVLSITPSLATAATWGPVGSEPAPQVTTSDVVLGPGGQFDGNVFDRSGRGLQGKQVAMLKDGRTVVSVTTDCDGSFRVRGVPVGTHRVSVEGRPHAFRVWRRGTEPPSATQFAFIVAETPVFRGQHRSGQPQLGPAYRPQRWRSHSVYDMIERHPVIAYTAMTAMIVVPIILIADKDDDI